MRIPITNWRHAPERPVIIRMVDPRPTNPNWNKAGMELHMYREDVVSKAGVGICNARCGMCAWPITRRDMETGKCIICGLKVPAEIYTQQMVESWK